MSGRGAVSTLVVLSACATTAAPVVVDGQTARIEIKPGRINGSNGATTMSGTFPVHLYDFANGCPAVRKTDESKGFKGSVRVPFDSASSMIVPAGRRILLEPVWDVSSPTAVMGFVVGGVVGGVALAVAGSLLDGGSCRALITFVPEPGSRYVLTYVAPTWSNGACGANARKIVKDAAGASTLVRPESFGILRTLEEPAISQPGGLCTLKP